MTESLPALLALDGVGKDYGVEVITHVLRDVSFTISRGELVALIGPSGSGKSTLLNLIGLLDRPTRGRVILDGQDTSGLDDDQLTAMRGRTLGFVFQFHHLLPAFTALENVMLPTWAALGEPPPELQAKAQGLLDVMGLGQFAQRRTSQLSGGQQQRVAIARALVRDPLLLLADEPTGNLDSASSEAVFEVLEGINRARATTLLLVTHDPRVAARSSRVIELVDGGVASDRRRWAGQPESGAARDAQSPIRGG